MNDVTVEDLNFIIDSVKGWERLLGKTILIAGANGMLPAYMVETLLHLNDKLKYKIKVVGLVRDIHKGRERFSAYAGRDDFNLIAHDINFPFKIDVPVDFIIHAASQASPKYFGTDPVGTLSANVLGTHNLLGVAREKKAEGFLYFSSGEVYGKVDDKLSLLKESSYGYLDPLDVRSCYGESKRMGETMCVAWNHQHGVPARIVRPFHTYGPGMRLDDGRVFADFVADVVYGRDIVMKSDGSAKRAFCYIADATVGFFSILFKGENCEAYNIGNDKAEISILDLANTLVRIAPSSKLKVNKVSERTDNYMKSEICRACPDISKARALGWEPHFGIEAGFLRTIQSYLGQELIVK